MDRITNGADLATFTSAYEALNRAALGYSSPINQKQAGALKDELDRLREKLDALTEGKTVLVMSDDDRAKHVLDLDDNTLAKWTRWVVAKTQEIVDRHGEDDPPVTSTMHAGITLGLFTLASGATEASFTVDGVTYKGQPKGTWKIKISQGATRAEEVLRMFRQFVQRNVTQWQVGAGDHHHPIWGEIAEVLDDADINHDVNDGPEWLFNLPDNRRSLDELWQDHGGKA